MNSKLSFSIFIGRVYFILLFFVSEIPAYGNRPMRLIRINYENTNGEKAFTLFFYNSRGILYRGYWQMTDSSRSSVNYYQYDKSNNLISVYREFSTGIIGYEFYSYDSLGHKMGEYFYRSDTLTGFAKYRYTGERLNEGECHQYKGWLDGMIYYHYDSLDHLASAIINDKNISIGSISYSYDSSGNLVKEIWQMHGWWTQTFEYLYEPWGCTESRNPDPLITGNCKYRLITDDFDFNHESGGPTQYTYNPKGLLIHKSYQRADGVNIQTIFFYNPAGRLIRSVETSSDGNAKIFTYNFDINDKEVFRSCYIKDTLSGFESYIYDTYGRLIKAYYRNFDQWLTGYVTFTYDDFDRLSEGHFKGMNGFNADISFKYNSENLLSEVIWGFSTGKFQKYLYHYQRLYD